jgi:deoxyribonuclease V
MATYEKLHEWGLTPTEAVALQKQLRGRVRLEPLARAVETIAGCDISFNKYEPTMYAGIVVLRLPSLEVVEEVGVVAQTSFPYVPGLLSFRETPPLLEAWSLLKTDPDALMLDGQGVAHPRRFGIASHVGLLTGRPALGCAKSILVGKFEGLSEERGGRVALVDKGETVGAAVRTKNRVQPVYVSPGHLIDIEASVDLVLKTDGGYRQPEPTRRAHLLVNALRRGEREPTPARAT